MSRCPNCGHEDALEYCPECGQRQGPLIPSLGDLVREAIHEAFELDGRFPKTLKLLFTRPGFVTNEWLVGRRARYLSPIRLYLVSSLAFFGAVSLFGFPVDYVDPGVSLQGDDPRTLTAMILEDRFQLIVTVAVLIGAPLMTVYNWLADKTGRSLVEHLVIVVHLLSVIFLSAAVLWVTRSLGVPGIAVGGVGLTLIAYYSIKMDREIFDHGLREAFSFPKRRVLGVLLMLASMVLGAGFGVVMADQIEDRIDEGQDQYAQFLYENWRTAVRDGDSTRVAPLRLAALEQYDRLGSLFHHQVWHTAELHLEGGAADPALEAIDGHLEHAPDDIAFLALSLEIAEAMDSTSLVDARKAALASRSAEEWTEALRDYRLHLDRLLPVRDRMVTSPAEPVDGFRMDSAQTLAPAKVGTTAVHPGGGSSPSAGPHTSSRR